MKTFLWRGLSKSSFLLVSLFCLNVLGASESWSQDHARVFLHISESPLSCDADLDCSETQTWAKLEAETENRYWVSVLVTSHDHQPEGMNGLQFAIWYEPGIEILSWTHCYERARPGDDWPASFSGINLYPQNCWWGQLDEVFVAGVFEVRVTEPSRMAIAERVRYSAGWWECDSGRIRVPQENLGWVSFGEENRSQGGCNPCIDACERIYPEYETPTHSRPDFREPKLLLHIEPANSQAKCNRTFESDYDFVTHAPAAPDGSNSYYVYLLAAPGTDGFSGMQLGLQYNAFDGEAGLNIHEWTHCSGLEFADSNWPALGSGNTITRPLNTCLNFDVFLAGYFYVTPYGASSMTLGPWPNTRLLKYADCSGGEGTFENVVPEHSVGWVDYIPSESGQTSFGCNPLNEPCQPGTAVKMNSWGKIKRHEAGHN